MNADRRPLYLVAGIIVTVLLMISSISACSGISFRPDESVTIYSGRSRELVGPALQQFEKETGIEVEVRYGNTAELAGTIAEEGDRSPADVFFAQDAGGLGALVKEGLLTQMPQELVDKVPKRFRSSENYWVGISGRARVVVYNTDRVDEKNLPNSILDFTESTWEGRIGWAPTNASFQAFATTMREQLGDEKTRQWLQAIDANNPRVYPNNTSTVDAVGRGEVDVGFVNHYYLLRFKEEDDGFPAQNHYLTGGDPGALINVAGVGILKTSNNKEDAQRLVEFLLSEQMQEYFTSETFEYPLAEDVAAHEDLPPLSDIDTPDMNLGNLRDLQATLQLLQQSGVLD